MLWIAIPLLLAAFWFGVSQLLGTLSGWRELAREYGANAPSSSIGSKITGGRVNGVTYGGCLVVGATGEGVSISMLALFRPGHQPLFVRWSDVTMAQDPASVAGAKLIRFRRVPDVTVELPEEMLSFLATAKNSR